MSHIVSLLYLSLGKMKPVANEEEQKKKHEAKIALYIVFVLAIVFKVSLYHLLVTCTKQKQALY